MQTCPHCHQPVRADSRYCEHCGYDLQARRHVQSPHRPHRSRWFSRILIGLLGLALLAVLGFAGVFYHRQAGRTKQITTITATITDDQPADFARNLISDDPSLKLTSDTVQPLLTYVRTHPSYVKTMRHDLVTNGTTRDQTFQVVTSGHAFGIFPRYKLRVTTMHPRLQTNVANATILANGAPVITAKNRHFTYTAGPFFPGHYVFKLTGARRTKRTAVNLVAQNDRHRDIDLTTQTAAAATTDSTTTASTAASSTTPTPRTTGSHSQTGQDAASFSGRDADAIAAVNDQYNFDDSDETYTVHEAHPDVLEVRAYDWVTDDPDGVYRYDTIHDIVSSYNPQTGKFETPDD
ncbi:hypothetical protein LZY01_17560 [Levilactobacillus zymae]|uniref:Zinc-ribbon domain-containing protein n=1 Tax=Levilactobacillus zymae TaxID=267363 RepID=A0ABQ0X547_9LACO|nr:zinc-ribbon domain-containing protein [Levilactobacillus zymae]QFR61905.1 zinc ribbon domain-containing protein [Levilactobacillus zymae]GEO72588.1 hypothetical protein LZY01_17560 [Levilactobacillus zymae]